MNEKTYGYIRVSSKDQNEDRQRIAMREFGIPDDFIFMDKQSGKDFERPGYKQLMRKIRPADTLVIKSIDRLGRNYIWNFPSRWRKGCNFRSAAAAGGTFCQREITMGSIVTALRPARAAPVSNWRRRKRIKAS